VTQVSSRLQNSARQTRFDEEVQRHLRWNFVTNMTYGLFGTTGWRMIFTPTFVPSYAFAITHSELLVGVLQFLNGLVRLLSPFGATAMVEHRRRVKPLAILFGGAMRSQLLFVALAAIFLFADYPLLNVVVFFVAMPICHGLGGMQGVAYGMVMSKVIPPTGRGIWNRNIFVGFRNALGGVTAIIVILIVRDAFADVPFPWDFAYLLLFAFTLTCIGLGFFAFTREPDSPEVAERESVARKILQIPETLRENPNFARFVVARSLAAIAFLAVPFYILHARALFGDIPGVEVNMTLYWMASASVMDPLWGFVAYRTGFRRVFLIAMALWILGSAIFAFAQTQIPIALAFATIAAAVGGFNISSNNMVFEFGDSSVRPRLIATSSTIGDVCRTVSGLGGGYLAELYSLPLLFVLATLFLAAAAWVMLRHVTEPRSPSLDEALRVETPGLGERPADER
jgi:MFS family permease